MLIAQYLDWCVKRALHLGWQADVEMWFESTDTLNKCKTLWEQDGSIPYQSSDCSGGKA
jgi:hypothetical protein